MGLGDEGARGSLHAAPPVDTISCGLQLLSQQTPFSGFAQIDLPWGCGVNLSLLEALLLGELDGPPELRLLLMKNTQDVK